MQNTHLSCQLKNDAMNVHYEFIISGEKNCHFLPLTSARPCVALNERNLIEINGLKINCLKFQVSD